MRLKPAGRRTPPRGRSLATLIRPLVARHRLSLAALALTSTASGFLEAALLFVVVKTAVAVAAGDDSFGIRAGAWLDQQVSMPQALTAAGVLVLAAFAVAYLNAAAGAWIWTQITASTRKELFRAYLNAPGETQYGETAGRLQDVMTTSVNRISQGVLSLTVGLGGGLQFVAMMVAAAVVDPLATAFLVLVIAGLSALLLPMMRLTRRKSETNRVAGLDYSLRIAEAVALARELRAFDVTPRAQGDMDASADRVAATSYTSRLVANITPNVFRFLVLGLVVAGLGLLSTTGIEDVADLGAVALLAVRSMTYAQTFNSSIQQANEMGPFLEQVADLRRLYRSSAVLRSGSPLGPVQSLTCDGVSYAYPAGRPVLTRVTWSLSRGESLGVVGPSGSGKSTLVQVLLRLRRPTEGRVLVNGLDAESIGRESWAARVVLVPQQNHLLRGSVADNIRFLRTGFDDAAVTRAARRAHLHDEVMALPDGYQTVVGSGAGDLSGGQLQRLGIARALLGDPDVLVLDEPTSALDMHSESLIQQTLTELHGDVMLIIVAHRLSTISQCDKILVLEGGRVTATGTPSQVLEDSSFYRRAMTLSGRG